MNTNRLTTRDLPADGDTSVTVTEAGQVCLWAENVHDGSLSPMLFTPEEAARAAQSLWLAASLANTVRHL